jgi:uncharacterized protein with NRDE domain
VCLILVGWRVHDEYPLVVAANRDEFFDRSALPAAFWSDAPGVLAGRDRQAGGTWLGISRSGRFAALTNFRDPSRQRTGMPSRGSLTVDFLAGTAPPMAYLQDLAARDSAFNGFNLLVGDDRQLCCYSNVVGVPHQLPPGVYGLSNHLLDTPWPKVAVAKTRLRAALAELPDHAALFSLLRDDAIHPDRQLPDTGVGAEWERLLSAAFVRTAEYGTRCSTVTFKHRDGRTTFDETTWLPGAGFGGRVRFAFAQPAGMPS